MYIYYIFDNNLFVYFMYIFVNVWDSVSLVVKDGLVIDVVFMIIGERSFFYVV